VIDPPLVVTAGLPIPCCHTGQSGRLSLHGIDAAGVGHLVVKGQVHGNLRHGRAAPGRNLWIVDVPVRRFCTQKLNRAAAVVKCGWQRLMLD